MTQTTKFLELDISAVGTPAQPKVYLDGSAITAEQTTIRFRKNLFGRFKLAYDGQTAAFTTGKTLTGATSGFTAIILRVEDLGGNTGVLHLINADLTKLPQDNEALSDNNTSPGAAVANGTLKNPSKVIGIHSEGFTERVYIPENSFDFATLKATNCVRGLPPYSLDLQTGYAEWRKAHHGSAEAVDVLSPQEYGMIQDFILGQLGSGGRKLVVGDETDSDMYVYFANGDANKPGIRYSASGNRLEFSDDGVSWNAMNVSGNHGTTALLKAHGDVAAEVSDSPASGDLLQYDSGINKWRKKSVAEVIGKAVQDASYSYDEDAEASDSYAITLAPAPTAYVAGQRFTFKVNTANTGAATLNVNALGAKTLKKYKDQDLESGDIVAGQIVEVAYDGVNMQVVSALKDGGERIEATLGEEITGAVPVPIAALANGAEQSVWSSTATGVQSPIHGANWVGQYVTLTPSVSPSSEWTHLTALAFWLGKIGTPSGNLNMSFYLGDANGKPTGAALKTASVVANSVSSGVYIWTFDTPLALAAATNKYVLVLSVPSGDSTNRIDWQASSTNPQGSANKLYSSNSGSTWGEENREQYLVITGKFIAPANAYGKASSVYATRKNYLGFLREAATVGQTKKLTRSGIIGGFSGLTPYAPVYISSSTAGEVTQAASGQPIGMAVSATQIDLGFPFAGYALVTVDETNKLKMMPIAITAGTTNTIAGANSTRTTQSTTYVKLKELVCPAAGTYRVSFYMDEGGEVANKYAYGRIYKNGVAFGTERSVYGNANNTFTEDLTFAKGDLIQLYAKSEVATNTTTVSTFNMKCDVTFVPVAPTGSVNLD